MCAVFQHIPALSAPAVTSMQEVRLLRHESVLSVPLQGRMFVGAYRRISVLSEFGIYNVTAYRYSASLRHYLKVCIVFEEIRSHGTFLITCVELGPLVPQCTLLSELSFIVKCFVLSWVRDDTK